ncbi:MAG: Acetolactate synthase 3 catalytic subunit [Actinomycetota bacterium]|nr:Acetolactate synthase 3 catalytic subunit [Actinomycetota bacterium]
MTDDTPATDMPATDTPATAGGRDGYFSDWLVDYLRRHGVSRFAFNPGASFRGVHDSLVATLGPGGDDLVMACHEEIAVAIAHGYHKASGRHMAVLLHANVGLLHGSMALFNAWCDRIPLLCLVGNGPLESGRRRPWIDWIHTAHDVLAPVRGYTALAASSTDQWGSADDLRRALRALQSRRLHGPAVVALDVAVQESPVEDRVLALPQAGFVHRPDRLDESDLQQVTSAVTAARRPVVLVERAARLPGILRALGEFCDVTGGRVPVVECGYSENTVSTARPEWIRLEEGLPTGEPPDLVIALDVTDPLGQLSFLYPRERLDRTQVISIDAAAAPLQSWSADVGVDPPGPVYLADGRDALERLTAALRVIGPFDHVPAVIRRAAVPTVLDTLLECTAEVLAAEGSDHVVVNGGSTGIDHAIRRVLRFTRERQYLGMNGGGGLGYGLPAAVGAAIALREDGSGTLPVAFLGDGDLLYTPSALWTAAARSVPLLMVVVNNGQYLNSVQHARAVARDRDRDTDPRIGTTFDDSPVPFDRLAAAFSIGSLRVDGTDRAELEAGLRTGLKAVAGGLPYLLEVTVA